MKEEVCSKNSFLLNVISFQESDRLGGTKKYNMKRYIFWIYGELQWSSDVVVRMQKVYKVAGRGQILL